MSKNKIEWRETLISSLAMEKAMSRPVRSWDGPFAGLRKWMWGPICRDCGKHYVPKRPLWRVCQECDDLFAADQDAERKRLEALSPEELEAELYRL